MTVKANFGLRSGLQNGIARRMTFMTVSTRNFIIIMRTCVPAEADIGVVTPKAHIILHGSRCCVIGPEFNYGWTLLPAPHSRRMRATGPVAGLTLKLPVSEGTAWIGRYRVFGPKYCKCHFVVVTCDAGVSPLFAVWGVRCGLAGRLRSRSWRNKQARHKQSSKTGDNLQVHSKTIPFQVLTAVTQSEPEVTSETPELN